MEHQTGDLADAKDARLAGWSRQHQPVKGNGDTTDPGRDQALPAPHGTGRAARHQPQDGAAMVFRTTAAGDTHIRPLTRQDMPTVPALPGDRRPIRADANGQRPMRVLLVDDHEISRAIISALLRTEGAEVADIGTGEAAVAVAIAFRPAVVIVDVAPADASGFVIADRLRALPGGPAVVLTSSAGRRRFASRLENYRFVAKADLCLQII
jgi:CheY-like chemotaxis protein